MNWAWPHGLFVLNCREENIFSLSRFHIIMFKNDDVLSRCEKIANELPIIIKIHCEINADRNVI